MQRIGPEKTKSRRKAALFSMTVKQVQQYDKFPFILKIITKL
jgi:hypothetical protein